MTLTDTTCPVNSEARTIVESLPPKDPSTPILNTPSKRPMTSTLQLKKIADATLPSVTTNGDPDSGYSSQTTTPNRDSTAERETNTNHGASISSIFSPKKKLLFNVDVDSATNERFKVIQPRLERLLLEYVRAHQRAGAKYKPMSTRLVTMGSSQDDASPHIVVFCRPENKKLVKRFITDPWIKDICQSSDPGVPSFEVKVIGNAPQLKLTNSPVEVTIDHIPTDTLCGTPIQLVHLLAKRNATFGGIIKVVAETGHAKLYGITAGHAVEEWHNELQPAHEVADENEDDTEHHDLQRAMGELSMNETESQGHSDSDDSDIEIDIFTMNTPSDIRSDEDAEQWSFTNPLVLGSIVIHASAPAVIKGHENQCYDWALFETNVCKMNRVASNSEAELVLSHKEPGTTGDRSVHMVSGSGSKKGQISSTPGRILLGSGEEFVSTYMLTIHDKRGICDGDSGSWVIDSRTFEVYGHLVASDMFGSGYVIPLKAIFADIKRRLHAKLVTLPNTFDIQNAMDKDQSASNVVSNLESVGVANPWFGRTSRIPRDTVIIRFPVTSDSGYSSMQTTPIPLSDYYAHASSTDSSSSESPG